MNIIDKIIASENEYLIDLAIGIYKNTDTFKSNEHFKFAYRREIRNNFRRNRKE